MNLPTPAGERFERVLHDVDVCVVGGGMAGLCAALAAARHGARVALLHDRPVLGGNASSEMRVHICGADRFNTIPYLRETGILEELRLENLRRNPHRNFSVWDLILYEKAQAEPNLVLLLNCSCLDATLEGDRLASVTGWQLTTQLFHTVRAAIFADCSGDAVLAPLTGAAYRVGRESRHEFGESLAPERADRCTMGMTCLFQAREYPTPQPFEPPAWIHRYASDAELPFGDAHGRWWGMGYWWVELGGEDDSIRDTERVRDELLKIALGVWDHIKNRGAHGAERWALEWLQFLPAKRESRRYVGDHLLTQGDIESEGRFADMAAYGGWTMDDHHPAGFRAVTLGHPATHWHAAPSPFGIPYRALYSQNIANLMFAGRCASCTHIAMSSTRVMGTGCSMGQAIGTAAALAARRGLTPRALAPHIPELQQTLLRDDGYLPWLPQRLPETTITAQLTASQGDPEPVRDGVNRPVKGDGHAWTHRPGDWLAYTFDAPRRVREVTLLLDSALERNPAMSFHQPPRPDQLYGVPDVMPKTFRLEGLIGDRWTDLHRVTGNYQRLVRLPVGREISGLRYTLEETWGAPHTLLYACYAD